MLFDSRKGRWSGSSHSAAIFGIPQIIAEFLFLLSFSLDVLNMFLCPSSICWTFTLSLHLPTYKQSTPIAHRNCATFYCIGNSRPAVDSSKHLLHSQDSKPDTDSNAKKAFPAASRGIRSNEAGSKLSPSQQNKGTPVKQRQAEALQIIKTGAALLPS